MKFISDVWNSDMTFDVLKEKLSKKNRIEEIRTTSSIQNKDTINSESQNGNIFFSIWQKE